MQQILHYLISDYISTSISVGDSNSMHVKSFNNFVMQQIKEKCTVWEKNEGGHMTTFLTIQNK